MVTCWHWDQSLTSCTPLHPYVTPLHFEMLLFHFHTLKINRLKTKQKAKHLSSHLGNSRIVLIKTMGLFRVKQSDCLMWSSGSVKRCWDCFLNKTRVLVSGVFYFYYRINTIQLHCWCFIFLSQIKQKKFFLFELRQLNFSVQPTRTLKVIRLYLESPRENDCASLLVHPRIPVF